MRLRRSPGVDSWRTRMHGSNRAHARSVAAEKALFLSAHSIHTSIAISWLRSKYADARTARWTGRRIEHRQGTRENLMKIASIESIPLRIPFTAGGMSDASVWGKAGLQTVDSLIVKITTDTGVV